MTYLSWAVHYEGPSDGYYLGVMLPRLIADLVAQRGTRQADIPEAPALVIAKRGAPAEIAVEACGDKDAFTMMFIHADTGGRHVERSIASRAQAVCLEMHLRCNWPESRCVALTPRHELEAWLLADPDAVMAALGYSGRSDELGLPATAAEAERLIDPKEVLSQAARHASGPRRRPRSIENLYAAIAQRQDLKTLRSSRSFQAFEDALVTCLASLQVVSKQAPT